MSGESKIVAKAQEIKDKSQDDPELADRLAKEPGAVISEHLLNPHVLAASDEPQAKGGCTCLPYTSCGMGCQGLVGIIEGSYGCESGKPI